MNPSDKYRLIKKGLHIAEAYQMRSILEENSNNDLDPSIFEVNKDTAEVNVSQSDSEGVSEEQKRLLPEDLEQVFKASTKQLSSTESLQLANLQVLKMSLQVLNLTLATFLQSSVRLTPIKLRMRRTPPCFINEKEAHLKTSSPMGNDRSPWSQHNVWRHHNL